MKSVTELLNEGIDHHRAGRLPQAEAIYRQILQREPNNAHALHQLGLVAYQSVQFESAAELIVRATAISPDVAMYWNNLGSALAGAGKKAEAAEAFEKAVKLQPDLAAGHNNLANALREQGKIEAAIRSYQKAIELNPNDAVAHSNLASALRTLGNVDEAIRLFRQAISIKPDYAEAYRNLGNAFHQQGKPADAEASIRKAIELKPNSAESYSALGLILRDISRASEALAAFEKSVQLNPNFGEGYCNLSSQLIAAGRFDDAMASRRKAVALHPTKSDVLENLLYGMHYDPHFKPDEIFREHVRWAKLHADPLLEKPPVYSYAQNRRLRIGYVSADFRHHPVANFFHPIIAHHNHKEFEIFCYSDVRTADEVTSSIKKHADEWRDILNLSDAAVAKKVRDDAIDILVDLSGHLDRNRLKVFARKPAPIQVTYLGYPDTTGMAAMDYRITDSLHDPPGQTERFHTERLIRLDPCAWCFDPRSDLRMDDLPAAKNGYITFGSLNNPIKLNAQLIELWAGILHRVPKSKMRLLVHDDGSGTKQIKTWFAKAGIESSRLELHGRCTQEQFLRSLSQIDIALDTYPYNGHTTTCQALWMGVPVVSLAGQTHVARAGLSVLTAVGLSGLVSLNSSGYERIAVDLASNSSYLTQLRSALRSTMLSSPLMNFATFTFRLERHFIRLGSLEDC